jgi:hypothetical protein
MLDDFAAAVTEELCEVPGDVSTVEFGVLSHVLVDWHAVWTIDFNLLEEWEAYVVLSNEFFDLRWPLWLLLAELVAWNCVDFQALVLVLLVNALQLLVVAISQTSVGCDVDEENGLFTGGMLSDGTQWLTIDVVNLVSVNGVYVGDWLAILEPDLHFIRESLSVCSEMWEVIQARWPFVHGVCESLLIDEIGVNVANPEVSDRQVWCAKPITISIGLFAEWLDDIQ